MNRSRGPSILAAALAVLALSTVACDDGKPPHSAQVAGEALSPRTQTFDMAELVGPADAPEVQFTLDVPESYQEQVVNPGWLRYKGSGQADVPTITVSFETEERTPRSLDEAVERARSGELVKDGLKLDPHFRERIDDGYLVVTRGGGWTRVHSWLKVPGGGSITCNLFIRKAEEASPLLDWGKQVCGSLSPA